MQLVKSLAFVLLLLSVVSCYTFNDNIYWSEGNGNTIEYDYLPANELGTFEGSYTSNTHLGHGLNICQDGSLIYGSYDQLGIFNGNVSASNVANGTWYQAGNTNCVTGTFQFTLTSDGFTGYYTCGKSPTQFYWNETKLSPFRPSDENCALMDSSSSSTLSGRFVDSAGLPKDFCYSTKLNASISFLFLDSNNQQQKGYFAGTAYSKGQIFLGTWYTLQPLAGADLYYLDVNGAVRSYFWTGLNGTDGTTLINPSEYYQPQYHGTRYYTGPISVAASSNCNDYATIKTKVLNNLAQYKPYDDDLYYFVSTAFNYVNDDDHHFKYDDGALDDDHFVNDASHIYWFSLPVLLALLF